MLFFTRKEITGKEQFFLSRRTSFLLISIIVCYLQILIPSIKTAVAADCGGTNCDNVKCTKKKHTKNQEVIDMQHEIIQELFWLEGTPVDDNIEYKDNYYACNCDLQVKFKGKIVCAYKGGHAGWDVRTTPGFDPPRNQEFFCITPGIVLANGGRNEKNGELPDCDTDNRAIVIYDESTGYATHYLHASDIRPLKIGEYVHFRQSLGWQGACGRVTGPHVHIEVRTLEWDLQCKSGIPYKDLTKEMINNLLQSSHGTKDNYRPTLDPIRYLYNCVKNPNNKTMCRIPEIWARCKMGQ